MKVPIIQNTILSPCEVEHILNSDNYSDEIKNLVKSALKKIDKASKNLNVPKSRLFPIIDIYNNATSIWFD